VKALCTFAVKAVRSGRRVTGMLKPKDVMSERTQRIHGFRVERLPQTTRTSHEILYGDLYGQRLPDGYEERLQDHGISPTAALAAFRLDFPAWLATRTARDRGIIQY